DFRGQGIGKKLVKEALDSIKMNHEVIKVNLAVNPHQDNAIKLYESFGFKPIGKLSQELFVNSKFYDQILMELFF
ncbi:MAG: N-acetyltransferase family protein, partial [Candidatus Hodarchaeales archaeon]